MKDKKILYLVLGFGCGVVLCAGIGLITSLNTEVYSNNVDVIKQSSEDTHTMNENKEYKIEKYADKTKEEDSLKDIDLPVVDEATDNVEETKVTDNIKTEVNDNVVENTSLPEEAYMYVEIPKYYGATQICQLLEERQIVDDADDFLMFIRDENKQTMLLDGKLQFKQGLTYEQVLNILTKNN